jgi:formate dehydrogenase maturation protein FdhE
MTTCDCIKKIEERLSDQLRDPRVDRDLLSGKTMSIVYYTETIKGKEKRRQEYITHNYCPWCGEKYDD